MNWFGHQNGEEFEYHLLVIGLFVSSLLGGKDYPFPKFRCKPS